MPRRKAVGERKRGERADEQFDNAFERTIRPRGKFVCHSLVQEQRTDVTSLTCRLPGQLSTEPVGAARLDRDARNNLCQAV